MIPNDMWHQSLPTTFLYLSRQIIIIIIINPSDSADAEYSASIRVSAPLVSKIEAQQRLVYATRKEKDDGLKEELEEASTERKKDQGPHREGKATFHQNKQ